MMINQYACLPTINKVPTAKPPPEEKKRRNKFVGGVSYRIVGVSMNIVIC